MIIPAIIEQLCIENDWSLEDSRIRVLGDERYEIRHSEDYTNTYGNLFCVVTLEGNNIEILDVTKALLTSIWDETIIPLADPNAISKIHQIVKQAATNSAIPPPTPQLF